MRSHGLDPTMYGFFCYDEWEATDATFDADGNLINEARESGNRYGIRYEELIMFILAAL